MMYNPREQAIRSSAEFTKNTARARNLDGEMDDATYNAICIIIDRCVDYMCAHQHAEWRDAMNTVTEDGLAGNCPHTALTLAHTTKRRMKLSALRLQSRSLDELLDEFLNEFDSKGGSPSWLTL